MAFAGEDDYVDYSASDDDLIEVHARPASHRNTANNNPLDELVAPRRSHPSSGGLPPVDINPAGDFGAPERPIQLDDGAPASLADMLRQRPHRPRPLPNQRGGGGGGAAGADTPVIDLTEEPDSPQQLRPLLPPLPPLPPISQAQSQSQSQSQIGRNPRRTNSLRLSTPRLARSDGTLIGREASVVDLTGEPEDEHRPPWQQQEHHRHHHHHHHHHPPGQQNNNRRYNIRPRPFPDDQLIELEFLNAGQSMQNMASNLAARFGQQLAGLWGGDMLLGNLRHHHRHPPHVDRDFANAHRPRVPVIPKPPMEPIPATREGFVRDTCAGDDEENSEQVEKVIICPSCEEELAYDPTGTVVQSSVGGGKKRKRAPGEHHFWALKKCGHVYCADCFENRRPTKANPNGVGFRSATGVLPLAAPNDVRCAVDDCETKVALKTEWVGIFL